nr:nucleoside phosphorylase [Nitrosomonas nitrosa]
MSQRGPFEALLTAKKYDEASVFAPEHLLREARRQKGLRETAVPDVCLLDPDGDIVRHLKGSGHAERAPFWACYHTDLYTFEYAGSRYGILGCAVGAPFAVLVAEELFASGCRFLMSMTSAGRITETRDPPYFVVIDRALRDEGTSYHYVPPALWSIADEALTAAVHGDLAEFRIPVERGASWTTDAPFRETATAIRRARDLGVLAVEMEAAALYAFAQARKRPVLCLAYVTNTMGSAVLDFEKGESNGVYDALDVIASARRTWELRDKNTISVQAAGK